MKEIKMVYLTIKKTVFLTNPLEIRIVHCKFLTVIKWQTLGIKAIRLSSLAKCSPLKMKFK